MHQKTNIQIKGYYQQNNVADNYDLRRFNGLGGEYINHAEISLVQTNLKLSLSASSPTVLDLGAGKGRLSIPLVKDGYRVHCLDASQSMLSYLKKHIDAQNIYIQSIFDPIKLKTKFDAITSLRFFDHFSISDQSKILKNTVKYLDKNGVYVYATLNSLSLEYLVSKFFPYGRYNYYYSPKTYARLFKKNGLQIVSTSSRFFFPRGLYLRLNQYPKMLNILIQFEKFVYQNTSHFGALKLFVLKKI